MRITRIATAAGAALTAAGMLTAGAPGAVMAGTPTPGTRPACPVARPGQARCLALYAPQTAVNRSLAAKAAGARVPPRSTTPKGWGPRSIQAAYHLPVTRGAGQVIGIVDAFSAPHLASDLAVYRKHYHLPACTSAGGCLRIVNQEGKPSPLPRPNQGWGIEETLDVSMVSAACPLCKIVIVEAKSATFANLAAAENTAVQLGAAVISNSYGGTESGFDQPYAKAYHHPGHVVVAASGDSGYTTAQFPANLATVTAAGGTELSRASTPRGWAEKAWNVPGVGAASSGCSAYVPKPPWQHDPHCPGRMVADVAALAWDVPIYDSSLPKRSGPWLILGGTSVASPLIAGVYGLAGNADTITPGYEYAHAGALFDITTGNNDWFNHAHGASCGFDYQCVTKKGYDGPTGLGTPNGTGGF